MKKYILVTCLLTSLFSFSADSPKYHTWFILNECLDLSSLETKATIKFVKALSYKMAKKDYNCTITLSSGEIINSKTPPSKLTSFTASGVVIFCSVKCKEREVSVDIYTDKMNFDRSDIGTFCRENFKALGYGMDYTTPD